MTNESSSTQELAAAAHQAQHGAPRAAKPTSKTNRKKAAPKGRKGAKKTVAQKPTTKNSAAGRPSSKKMAVLDLLRRKGGATLQEIAKATGWPTRSGDSLAARSASAWQ